MFCIYLYVSTCRWVTVFIIVNIFMVSMPPKEAHETRFTIILNLLSAPLY